MDAKRTSFAVSWRSLTILVAMFLSAALVFLNQNKSPNVAVRVESSSLHGDATRHNVDVGRLREFIKRERIRIESMYGKRELQLSSWSNSGKSHLLRNVFFKAFYQGRSISIAVVGGSSTAGAGGVGVNNTFPVILGNWLQTALHVSQSKATVNVRNAACGSTFSGWAAAVMSKQLGKKTDILLWEYAINDGLYHPEGRVQAIELFLRRALILFGPSVSIGFAYLWDHPNRWPPSCLTQFCQEGILKRYAEYGYDMTTASACEAVRHHNITREAILADAHHPTLYGHQMVSDMLAYKYMEVFDLILDGVPVDPVIPPSAHQITPVCEGNVLDILNNASAFAPRLNHSPWFGESPEGLTSNCSSADKKCVDEKAVLFGAQDPLRMDRKFTWEIPKCKQGGIKYDINHRYTLFGLQARNKEKGNLKPYEKMPVPYVKVNGVPISHVQDLPDALLRGESLPALWYFLDPPRTPFTLELCMRDDWPSVVTSDTLLFVLP